MRRIFQFVALFHVISGAALAEIDPEVVNKFELPEPEAAQLKDKKKLWGTEYHIHQAKQNDYGYPLLDKVGMSLGARLNHHDWCESSLEGTVAVRYPDNQFKVFNYDGVGTHTQVNCYYKYPRLPEGVRIKLGKTRFRVANGPFGDGYEDHILSPFRTLAVDPKVFPMRTVFYIPAARGVSFELPNGETRIHDGYFFAADIGGAIKLDHIDFFIAFSDKNPFSFVKGPNKYFDAFVLTDEPLMEALLKIHMPPPPPPAPAPE